MTITKDEMSTVYLLTMQNASRLISHRSEEEQQDVLKILALALEMTARSAIETHWKIYPSNRPEKEGDYLVDARGLIEVSSYCKKENKFLWNVMDEDITRWRPMPR